MSSICAFSPHLRPRFEACWPLLLQVQAAGLRSLSQQELQLRSTVAKLVNTEETYEVTSGCISCLISACMAAAAQHQALCLPSQRHGSARVSMQQMPYKQH